MLVSLIHIDAEKGQAQMSVEVNDAIGAQSVGGKDGLANAPLFVDRYRDGIADLGEQMVSTPQSF
jgi:hypothetical protein